MTKMKIEIVSTQHIKPSSPTPTQLRDFKLSFIDERIPPSYTPLILYYTFSEDAAHINQLQMCERLKSSLSDALHQYYPLAGRFKAQIFVDCNDVGILCIEANSDANISDIIKFPESGVLDKLIPFVANGNVTTAGEQLALQITSFNCGGITIGICISHRIADGCTLSSFIKYWSAIASNLTLPFPPLFTSSTLFPPRNTPDFRPNFTSLSVQPPPLNVTTKRFVFTTAAINALKLQVTQNSPTRVEVLTAFLWSRCMAAKGAGSVKRSVAYHPVNLRGKTPLLTNNLFGNVFQMVSAESGEQGKTEWVELVEKLRTAFGEMNCEYVEKLLGEGGFELAKENFTEISKLLAVGDVEVFRFTSFCRFSFYEADFGWGKPVFVSSGGYGNKDSVFLFDSVEWGWGGVEAWVVMCDDDMGRLVQDLELQRFTSDVAS